MTILMRLRTVRPVVTAIGVVGAAAATPVAVVPKHEHARRQTMVKTTVAVQVIVNLVQIIQDALLAVMGRGPTVEMLL